MSTNSKTGREALLTPDESVLLLIDHQPFQFANLHSHEPTVVVNNVVGLAKAAMGVQRMVQAGAVPITWGAVMGELQRDWARLETAVRVAEVQAQHGGGSGIAFAWETQLLATPTPEQAVPAGA